ncbi:MAG: sugar phosphate nucleotidyltransferase [Acidimicrobiales bacterium]
MKAVVLVGGFGTRLRPLTLLTPKQMLPVIDRPMIEHVIAGLAGHGIDTAVLALGYREDAFRAAYPDGRCAGVDLVYAVEPEPLDTAGAVRFAARAAGLDSTFVVVNGDVITDLDVTALVDRHRASGAEATIGLTPVDDPSRYGVVPTDAEGRVLGFVEKPPPGEAPTNWINAGAYVMEPTLPDRVADGTRVSLEREIFPDIVTEGGLWAVRSDSYWVDAGTPATYLKVQLDLLDGKRGDPVPGVAESAIIHPEATVERSVVMAGARIEAGAEVRDAAVQTGAVVGPGAHVEASIIGPRARVGRGAVVLDETVVGEGVVVADGAHLHEARVAEVR